jgi:hypothetical protein
MYDLGTIKALNAKRPEPVSEDDLDEIIELWAYSKLAESWLDERLYSLALELKWRREQMRGEK